MKRQTLLKSTLCLLMALVCNVTWAAVTLPTVSTDTEMHYYRIKSLRTSKYAAYTADNTQLAQTNEFTNSTIWYVTADGDNYKLHNLSTDKKYASVSSFTDNGATVYIKENPHRSGYVCVSTTENLSSNCWDDQNNGTKIGNYNPSQNDNEGTSWTFEEVTPSTYTFMLNETTSGTTYTGSYTCYMGEGSKSLPACVTSIGATLSNIVWDENTLTADINFPFPVSKEGDENWTFIRCYMSSTETYFYANGNNVVTKSAVAENNKLYLPSNNADAIKKYQWAIYPTLKDGKFTFKVKNHAVGKFIAGSRSANSVNLADTGADFCWGTCIGSGSGFYLANNTNIFFAGNSSNSGEKNAILWDRNGTTHMGGNLSFVKAAFSITFDNTGYTTLYTPGAVTIPNGVAAYAVKQGTLYKGAVNTTIPANTAVILKGEVSTTYVFSPATSNAAPLGGNVLQGSETDLEVSNIEGSVYTFDASNETFTKVTESTIPGYTAFLVAQSDEDAIELTEELETITTLEGWSNNYTFKVYGERGFIYATASDAKPKGSNSAGGTYDMWNDYHHFAIVKYGEKYYLYNVGKQKFVIKDGNGVNFSDTPSDAMTITATTATSDYHWIMNLAGANVHLSTGSGNTNGIRCADGEDGGTRWNFIKVGSFDASKIEANIAAITAATTANANFDIYGLQRYYGLVQNAGTGLNGDGQIHCNHPASTTQESGNAYANLIDGSYTSFFHSGYGGSRGNGSAHYLQFALNKPVKSFRFYFKKRSQNNDNRPKEILIEGSVDGNSFETISTISEGLPSGASPVDYYSDAINTTKAYSHLRFTVKKTHGDEISGNPFFTFSEFYILPEYAKVTEAFNAVRNYRAASTVTFELAEALIAAYDWNTGLSKGTPIVGADHFFFADTKQSDNSYVARYLYNNNGALATSTSLNAKDAKFIWTAAQPEGTQYYTLQNKGDNTKYISYGNNGNGLGVGTTAVQLDIKSSEAVHTGSVGIKRVGTDDNGKYMVTAADGSSFNRNSSKVNNGSWCSDYMFIPADLYDGLNTLTIVSNAAKADAVFTWDIYEAAAGSSILCSATDEVADGTLRVKSCNPAYKLEGFYSDAAHTQKITELNTLTSDVTVYAKFVLDIFSANYGEKWVRLQNCSNNSYWATTDGTTGKTATLDYADEKQLWCLVGTAESFVLYNKSTGNQKALKVTAETYGNGSLATIESDLTATWKLKSQNFGYALVPTHNTNNSDLGINMYGGAGGDLKLFNTGSSNTGSYWMVEAVDVKNSLTLGVEVTGEQPYATNTRVAHLSTTINGAASNTIVKGNVAALTYYLPVGATFTLNNSLTYRGYIFDGFLDAEGNAAKYTNATIPEGGLNITASYSVDEENKYQYLAYSNDERLNKPYRIPAIATASNGTVIAAYDFRPGGGDVGQGEVDIMVRLSYNNGETWTAEECIANSTGSSQNLFDSSFGDAAIVADRESDEVLIMHVGGRVFYGSANANNRPMMGKIVSHDNGENWDAPVNMSAQFIKESTSLFPNAHAMFFGSGRIVQSRVFKAEGSKYYRIYGALLVRNHDGTNAGDDNFVVYSDDFGATWKLLGGLCCDGGNEPKVEELPNGDIVLSSRKSYGRYFNIFKFTDIAKGEGSWSTAVASNNQTGGISFGGNSCNGEIYKVKAIHNESGRICDVMLQSVPTGSGRSNVSVYFKEMSYAEAYTPTTFAQNWTKGLEVSPYESAYSTLTQQADGNFGFFYEEAPNAFCLVYVPLSLKEMTNGAYSLYTVNSTITEAEIGTFYASEAMQIPAGVKAYVATEDNIENGIITMTRLEGIIPAHTGAVLRGEANTYNFIPSISYGTPVDGNMLVGHEADNSKDSEENRLSVEIPTDATIYVLASDKDGVKFYKKSQAFFVKNNKAYLQVPNSTGQQTIKYSTRFADEIDEEGEGNGTTGVEMTTDNSQQTTVIFDLTGRRVENPTKGVYVINGKKVVVK